MKAESAVVVTNRAEARIKYEHFETVSSADGVYASATCQMCGAPLTPNEPHACSKPDFDQPPHAVAPRRAPIESATFPFLIHPGITWRFEGRVYRSTNSDANFIETRAQFFELVGNGILVEAYHDPAM